MIDIPIDILFCIKNACDINGDGELTYNAEKDGQTYDEVSIFNKACKSYNSEAGTVVINNVVRKIRDLYDQYFVKNNDQKNAQKEKQDALRVDNQDQVRYFENQLTKVSWAKKWIEDNSKDKTVARNLEKFEPYFEEAAKAYKVPKNVLKGICMKESTYGASSKNVMQIMGADTLEALDMTAQDVYNPRVCIIKAAKRLRMALDLANGNIAKALVGYNIGEGKKAFINWSGVYKGGYVDKVLSFALVFDELDRQNDKA